MMNDQLIEYYKESNLIDEDFSDSETRMSVTSTSLMEIVEKLAEIKANPPKELTEDIRKEYRQSDWAQLVNNYKMTTNKKLKK